MVEGRGEEPTPEPLLMHQDLWAPWRIAYLRDLDRRKAELEPGTPALANFIAHAWAHPELDSETHVVYRNQHGLVILNRYPYANGHLLVGLGEARPRLLDYSPQERAEFWKLMDTAVALIEGCFSPHGVNMGVNQGDAAGAGLPQHLHGHVVPRWSGDVNFISTIAGVRVVPESLESVAERIREAIDNGILES